MNLPQRTLGKIKRFWKQRKNLEKRERGQPKEKSGLYFYCHPLDWWNRFNDVADIEIFPWRSFNASSQKKLIPNNKFGGKIFDILFNLEESYPQFFVTNFQYPMIIIKKR